MYIPQHDSMQPSDIFAYYVFVFVSFFVMHPKLWFRLRNIGPGDTEPLNPYETAQHALRARMCYAVLFGWVLIEPKPTVGVIVQATPVVLSTLLAVYWLHHRLLKPPFKEASQTDGVDTAPSDLESD